MNFYHRQFDDCYAEAENAVKLLLYKRHNDLFDKVSFDSEKLFKDPYVYAYLNQPDNEWLDSVLFGYSLNTSPVRVYSNGEGVIYLPVVGYLLTDIPDAAFLYDRQAKQGSKLIYNGGPVKYELQPVTFIDETIEVISYAHPLLRQLFVDRAGAPVHVHIDGLYKLYRESLEKALRVIAAVNPLYYRLLKRNIQKVAIFKGAINCFAAIKAHHALFLSVNEDSDQIFFLDHLLHEGSHIIFNTLTFTTKVQLFVIPYNSPMSQFSGDSSDKGQLYDTFHGLFTQSNINENLELCIQKEVFNGREHHELCGRLVSNMKRFRLAIEKFNKPEMYQPEGAMWYSFFRNKYKTLYKRNKQLIDRFDLSNQAYVFSYDKFLELNPLTSG